MIGGVDNCCSQEKGFCESNNSRTAIIEIKKRKIYYMNDYAKELFQLTDEDIGKSARLLTIQLYYRQKRFLKRHFKIEKQSTLSIRNISNHLGSKKKKGFKIPNEHDIHVYPIYQSEQFIGIKLVIEQKGNIIEKDKITLCNDQYKPLLKNMQHAYVFLKIEYDTQGQIIDLVFLEANHQFEELIAFHVESVMGRRFSVILPEIHSFVMEKMNHIMGNMVEGEYTLRDLYIPQHHRWFDIILYTIHPDKVAAILTDITAQKSSESKLMAAKEALVVANRIKSDFLENMSHEIRTPISVIIGMLDLTLQTDLSYEQKSKLIIAKQGTNELIGIIENILNYENLELNQVCLKEEVFRFDDVVADLISSYSRIKRNEINFEVNISPLIPEYLTGDSVRLYSVLNNLLENAYKFTKIGTISLEILPVDVINDMVMILFRIADTGIGIATEDQWKVFESFAQVDVSSTKKYGGTGLGLSISKKIVELMGGTIEVNSKENWGSTFQFQLRFPIGKVHSATLDLKKKNLRRNIVLITTNPDRAHMIGDMVKYFGHKLWMFEEHNMLWESFPFHNFDIVLFDLGNSSYDLLQDIYLKKSKYLDVRQLPYIGILESSERTVNQLFNMNMDCYLKLPVRLETFHQFILILSRGSNKEEGLDERLPLEMLEEGLGSHNDKILQKHRKIDELEIDLDVIETAIGYENTGMIKMLLNEISQIAKEIGIPDCLHVIGDNTRNYPIAKEDIVHYVNNMKDLLKEFRKSLQF